MTRPLAKLSDLKELLTIREICRLFNVHPNTLRNWDRSGKLKAVRIGSRKDRRYKKEDVLSFFYGKAPAGEVLQEETSSQDFEPLGSLLPDSKEEEK